MQHWRQQAPVLRAMVENWQTDPALTTLWSEMIGGFTEAAARRIARDRAQGRAPATGLDPLTLASALCWGNERVFYLAAIGHPLFADEQRVVDALTHIWLSAVYGPAKQEA